MPLPPDEGGAWSALHRGPAANLAHLGRPGFQGAQAKNRREARTRRRAGESGKPVMGLRGAKEGALRETAGSRAVRRLLLAHASVSDCAVAARTTVQGTEELVAFVV